MKNDILMPICGQGVFKVFQKTKTIELKKKLVDIEPTFRIFVYCNNDTEKLHLIKPGVAVKGSTVNQPRLNLNGKIVGHCTCTTIYTIHFNKKTGKYDIDDNMLSQIGMNQEEILAYGQGQPLYGYELRSFLPYCGPCEPNKAYRILNNNKEFLKSAPKVMCYINGVE